MSFAGSLVHLAAELKRRKVFRLGSVYLVVAWILIQVATTTFPYLHLPDWTITAVILSAVAGFPLALILAWAFEVRREVSVSSAAPPLRVHRGRAASAVVLAVVLLTGGWVAAARISGAEAPGERIGLALFPLRTSGSAAEGWSEGLPDLLATALDETPGLRVADPWSLWSELPAGAANREELPVPLARELADRAGARLFTLGALVTAGERLYLTLRLYDQNALEPKLSLSLHGSQDSIPDLVRRAALALITRLAAADMPVREHGLQVIATDDPESLKAYLAARAAMRRGLVDSAQSAIEHALALDSTFALALAEATVVQSWAQWLRGELYSGLLPLASRALAHSAELNERNRRRAQFTMASLRTRGYAAEAAALRMTEIDSTDHAGWEGLSYARLAYGWQYGATAADALAATEHSLRLDSGYVPALVRRAWLAVAVEDSAAVRSRREQLARADGTVPLVRGTAVAMDALLAPDSVFRGSVDSLGAGPDWIYALRMLRLWDPDRAELLLARMRAGVGVARARGESARLALARGHAGTLVGELQRGDYGELAPMAWRFVLAAGLVNLAEPGHGAVAAAQLLRETPIDSALAYFETRPVWWNTWLVGAHHAFFGDTLVTKRIQRMIGTLPAGGTPLDYRLALIADLDSRVAMRRGDSGAALQHARDALYHWAIHSDNDYEALPAPAIRFQLALAYRDGAQPDSAEAMLRSLLPPGTWLGFLTPRAALELGDLLLARGARGEAATAYALALKYWEGQGPEAAAFARRAAEGLRDASPEVRRARRP